MITQNYLPILSNGFPTASSGVKKAESDSISTFPQFKDFLEGAYSKPHESSSKSSDGAKTASANANDSVQGEQKPYASTFKEAEKNHSKEVKTQKPQNLKQTAEADKSTDSSDKVDKQGGNLEEKAAMMISGLAQLLGMKSEDLKKVLDNINVKPDELANPDKISEIVDKISAFTGITQQQKTVLTEIIKITGEQVEAALKQDNDQDVKGEVNNKAVKFANKHLEGFIKPEVMEVETVKTGEIIKDAAALMTEVKSALDDLSNRFRQNKQQFISQVTENVKAAVMQENLEAEDGHKSDAEGLGTQDDKKADASVTKQKSENVPVETAKDEPKTVKAPVEQEKSNKDTDAPDHGLPDDVKKVEPRPTNTEKAADNQNVQFSTVNQMQKTEGTGETAKLNATAHVSKNEIISQVVEKAKVVLDGEKSEMIMDLKPDHLGKLSLKIVTERGMVVARFTAENDQVKAVLESNMQLLKDSLEKQGLSVQGFSVSVGQDSQRNLNREQNPGMYENRFSGRSAVYGAVFNTVPAAGNIPQTPNPYAWNESRINLTA